MVPHTLPAAGCMYISVRTRPPCLHQSCTAAVVQCHHHLCQLFHHQICVAIMLLAPYWRLKQRGSGAMLVAPDMSAATMHMRHAGVTAAGWGGGLSTGQSRQEDKQLKAGRSCAPALLLFGCWLVDLVGGCQVLCVRRVWAGQLALWLADQFDECQGCNLPGCVVRSFSF